MYAEQLGYLEINLPQQNYINYEKCDNFFLNLTFWYAINHKWQISECFKFWMTLFESTIVALTDTAENICTNYSSLKNIH